MIGEYRKKPVVVEAIPWTGENRKEVSDFVLGARRSLSWSRDDWLQIKTLEGWVNCPVGHLIIKGVAGEVYPCDPDIFAQTYESV